MINEAIILAGGLGTRLRSVVSDTPKCMAPVAGKPFLFYLIDFLQKSKVEHFIFSLGYMHEVIDHYLKNNFVKLNYRISLENEPLGTGGAIKRACKKTMSKDVLVCNGDTFYKIDCKALSRFHKEKNATCTLSLKPMINFDRYGVVEITDEGSIRSFREKQFYPEGLINGGFYALDVNKFLQEDLPEKFSFEKDYLEKFILLENQKTKFYGLIQDAYFIDIGIPKDFEKAQTDFLR